MRVLVATDRGSHHQTNELIDVLNRRGALTYLIFPENLTREIVAESDIVIIDPGLSYDESIDICRRVRLDSNVPVIMITDSDRNSHTSGLRSGVNDYAATPFSVDEIVAKVFSVTMLRGRASGWSKPGHIDGMTIDVSQTAVTIGNEVVKLTKKEFQILLLIANENGAVCSREMIAAEVWGLPGSDVYDSIQILMSRLRAKLGHERIKTVRNVGYRLMTPPATITRTPPPEEEARARRPLSCGLLNQLAPYSPRPAHPLAGLFGADPVRCQRQPQPAGPSGAATTDH